MTRECLWVWIYDTFRIIGELDALFEFDIFRSVLYYYWGFYGGLCVDFVFTSRRSRETREMNDSVYIALFWSGPV